MLSISSLMVEKEQRLRHGKETATSRIAAGAGLHSELLLHVPGPLIIPETYHVICADILALCEHLLLLSLNAQILVARAFLM